MARMYFRSCDLALGASCVRVEEAVLGLVLVTTWRD